MNSFNWAQFIESEDSGKPGAAKSEGGFDWDKYADKESQPTEERPFFGQYAKYTREEYEKLPPEEKKRLQSYVPLTGFAKGVASGLTLGTTEHIPGLKTSQEEPFTGFGQFVGESAPITGAFKAATFGLGKLASKFPSIQKFTSYAVPTVAAFATGATIEAGKEAISGEVPSVSESAKQGALFAAFELAFKGAKGVYNFARTLNTKQQTQLLVDKIIPENLPRSRYVEAENALNELRILEQQEMEKAFGEATAQSKLQHQQRMNNARAQHESDLREFESKKTASIEDFQREKEAYNNKLRNIQAEHELELRTIEEEKNRLNEEYQRQRQEFEKTKKPTDIFEKTAFKEGESGKSLGGRVTENIEDMGLRPAPTVEQNPSLSNRVGNIFSENQTYNTTQGGQGIAKTVRDTDQKIYREVNDKYNKSKELNKNVETIHPSLAQSLNSRLVELKKIPEPSSAQKQAIKAMENILSATATVEEGVITGLKPINNQVLIEQMQSLRQTIDFDFAHGDAKNIFKPIINDIQNSLELAAEHVGDLAAVEANREARKAYKDWVSLFDSDYVRPIRNLSNKDYSKMYKGALDFDEFNVLDQVLQKSSEGQVLSKSIKRDLVEKNLAKYLENPHNISPDQFDKALREMRAVITPNEEYLIRQEFIKARKTPVIKAKKIQSMEPKELKYPKEIEKVDIPVFTKKPKEVKEITQVKIPTYQEPKFTPEMKIASQYTKNPPEKLLSKLDTRTGIKELRQDLSSSKPRKEIFDKITKQKVRSILKEGNIEKDFTGDDLFKVLNDENNFEILSEIIGEEATEAARLTAKEIGKKQMRGEGIKNLSKKAATLKFLYSIIPLI